MSPFIFTIGNFGVRWYSVLIIVGILLVLFLTKIEAKKFEIRNDFVVNLIFWACIIGFIGARLYFVLFHLEYYSSHLNEIYRVWDGGLAIHGGIIFGTITAILYCKKYNVNSLLMLDIVAPYMLIAQSIGRWGNFFNSEAYGVQTTLIHLKNLHIPAFIIEGMLIDGTYYTPTFLYESLWCLLGAIIILCIRKIKYIKIGQQAGTYLIWYSIGRFFIEKLRLDSLMFMNLKIAQIMSIALVIVGIIIIVMQSKKPKLQDLYNSKEKVEVVNF